MNREQIKEEAIESFLSNGEKGTLALPTGTGKSNIAIELLKQEKYDKIALIVPSVVLRDVNWKAEFLKWDAMEIYDKVDRYCYASIHDVRDKEYDIVILDEVHRLTENNKVFFDQNIVHRILGLTATLPEDDDKLEIIDTLCPVVYSKGIDELTGNIISDYEVFVMYVDLDDQVPDQPWKQGMVTEAAAYAKLSWLINRAEDKFRQILQLRRMRLLSGAKNKIDAAKYILEKTEDRTLVFAGSIEAATSICEDSYHSKTNDSKLIAFKNGEIDKLSSVKSLNEGHNIDNLGTIILAGLDSKSLNLTQRIGRALRFKGVAKIYIIICRNTQDTRWFNNASKELDVNKIHFLDFKTWKYYNS